MQDIFQNASVTEWALLVSFWTMLLVVAWQDYREHIVHDGVLLAFSALNFVLLLILGRELKEILWGFVGGFLLYYPIYFLAKIFYKREAFGLGDVHFLMSIGLVLGARKTLAVGISSFYFALLMILLGRIFGKKWSRGEEFPFAPAMAIAAFVFSIAGDVILRWFLA